MHQQPIPLSNSFTLRFKYEAHTVINECPVYSLDGIMRIENLQGAGLDVRRELVERICRGWASVSAGVNGWCRLHRLGKINSSRYG